jgi:hypothetical protein
MTDRVVSCKKNKEEIFCLYSQSCQDLKFKEILIKEKKSVILTWDFSTFPSQPSQRCLVEMEKE